MKWMFDKIVYLNRIRRGFGLAGFWQWLTWYISPSISLGS